MSLKDKETRCYLLTSHLGMAAYFKILSEKDYKEAVYHRLRAVIESTQPGAERLSVTSLLQIISHDSREVRVTQTLNWYMAHFLMPIQIKLRAQAVHSLVEKFPYSFTRVADTMEIVTDAPDKAV